MKESIGIIQGEHRSISSVLHALKHLTRIAQVTEKDFQALFSRLVNLAPAPVGVGEPWKKASVADR